MKQSPYRPHSKSRTVLWSIWALALLVFCMGSEGCTTGEVDLEARIQRIEASLLPGPGIVIQGRPWPQASLTERMEAYRVPGVSIAVFRDFQVEWAKGYGTLLIAARSTQRDRRRNWRQATLAGTGSRKCGTYCAASS